jgi:hypothetical protein
MIAPGLYAGNHPLEYFSGGCDRIILSGFPEAVAVGYSNLYAKI